MMKKFIAAATVAALVGISSSCFAGFGLLRSSSPAKAGNQTTSQSSSTEASVDMSAITSKQANILKYMRGAMLAQKASLKVVADALEVADSDLAQADAALKSDKPKDIKKVNDILTQFQENLGKQLANIDKQNVDKINLARAIKTGKVYQQAAIVNYAFVAANAPGALSEASGAVKNVGKNPASLNKINGAIATFKLGIEYAGKAQDFSKNYGLAVDAIKNDFGVDDATMANAPAPDVETIANECLSVIGE